VGTPPSEAIQQFVLPLADHPAEGIPAIVGKQLANRLARCFVHRYAVLLGVCPQRDNLLVAEPQRDNHDLYDAMDDIRHEAWTG
jgi:hypothetical protein